MDIYTRTEALIGIEAMNKLKKSKVMVFGIGGVGSHAVEALARSGVGSFILIDGGDIDITNLNRQIHATVDTIGRPKAEVMMERILKINPDITVKTYKHFYLPQSSEIIFEPDCTYILDAVDTVSAKIKIILRAKEMGIPVISCMGTGNKLNPTSFKTGDIFMTDTDPLARVIRKELKKRGVNSLKVVFSRETPIKNKRTENNHIPASIAFVTPAAGLIMAAEVVKDIINTERN